jgi:hypothetical protein
LIYPWKFVVKFTISELKCFSDKKKRSMVFFWLVKRK